VKELTSATLADGKLTLNFANAASIVAGKPYLVKVAENVENPTIAGVIVSKDAQPFTSTDVDFIPTLGLTEITGDTKEILFLAAGNKLLHPSAENQSMKGFRAYFQLKGNAVNAASFNLDLGEGETTGLNLTPSLSQGEGACYDLSGRKINSQFSIFNSQLPKGVYIQNGKKLIIK
jgi:hypothetical protein